MKKKQLLQEELYWRDYFDHEDEYAMWDEKYAKGEVPLADLHSAMADNNTRIAEIEQQIEEDEGFLSLQDPRTLSAEEKEEYYAVEKRLAANKFDLAQKKAAVESQNRAYNYYWSKIEEDAQASGAAATTANAQTAQALRQVDTRDLYRIYMRVGSDAAYLAGDHQTVTALEELDPMALAVPEIDNSMHMTKEERQLFLYLCNTGNYDAAKILWEELRPVLTQRFGVAMGEMADFPVFREVNVLGKSAVTAFRNIYHGVGSLFTDMDAPEATAGEYMVGHLQEKHKGTLAGYTTAAAASIGNQIPSFMAYAVNPALGKATTFFSTRGGAYVDAKRNGASHGEAWVYSTLVGAAETGLETVLGAMGGKAKGLIPDTITQLKLLILIG